MPVSAYVTVSNFCLVALQILVNKIAMTIKLMESAFPEW